MKIIINYELDTKNTLNLNDLNRCLILYSRANNKKMPNKMILGKWELEQFKDMTYEGNNERKFNKFFGIEVEPIDKDNYFELI